MIHNNFTFVTGKEEIPGIEITKLSKTKFTPESLGLNSGTLLNELEISH